MRRVGSLAKLEDEWHAATAEFHRTPPDPQHTFNLPDADEDEEEEPGT